MAEERTVPLRYDPARPAAKTPALQGRGTSARGLFVELGSGGVLGREPGCLLPLAFEGVSRRHAELWSDGPSGTFMLRDLGSTNGTLVNGIVVTEHALVAGDLIQIGAIQLEYKILTAPDLARARRLADALRRLGVLSERELQVAVLVAEGLRSAEIAGRLKITVRTVNSHLEHAYERLEIRSRMVLTRLVIEAQLIEA